MKRTEQAVGSRRCRAGVVRACTVALLALHASAAEADAPAGSAEPIVVESALLRVDAEASTPARAAGVLSMVDVAEGDLVVEGEVLARIDDREAELIHRRAVLELELARQDAEHVVAIDWAEKTLEFSRNEHRRLKGAREALPGSISQSEVDESQVKAEQARLDVEEARHQHRRDGLTAQLKETERDVAAHSRDLHRIVAPISGMVVEVMRRRGEWVEPGEDVMRIVRVDRLRAEGLVRVEDALRGLQGAKAEVTVVTSGGQELSAEGVVVFVNPEVNAVNGRVRIRAEFDNRDGRLMPGMRASMIIRPVPATEGE